LIVVMFLASWMGGRAGETYHRESGGNVIRSDSSARTTTIP
jgi:hypothetical protein